MAVILFGNNSYLESQGSEKYHRVVDIMSTSRPDVAVDKLFVVYNHTHTTRLFEHRIYLNEIHTCSLGHTKLRAEIMSTLLIVRTEHMIEDKVIY